MAHHQTCSAELVICTPQAILQSIAMLQSDLQISLCTVYHTILQCNFYVMQLTVQFTLNGPAVMQCCNIMAFEQNILTRLFLFFKQKEINFPQFSGMVAQC